MSFTVRFLNYAGDDLLGTVTAEYGEDITNKAPTPETIIGKTFTGWNAPITSIVEDMTVRPTYSVSAFSVKFYKADNITVLSEQTVNYGGDAVAPAPETVEGKTFNKWDKSYKNVTSDLDVYAVYDSLVFTVRVLNKDKTDVWSVQEVEYGKNADAPVPVRYSGFIFIGWSGSFFNITENKTIYPVYREVPPHPTLYFFKKNSDGSSGALKKKYNAVNSCNITQKLSGECTIGLKLLTRQTEGIISVEDRIEVEGLAFYVTELKKNISNGMCYTELNGEHISYILNDDIYKVTAYENQNTPREILKDLLRGTPFTVGKVDYDDVVTLRVNRDATRRACVMQLIAIVGGEIEYDGYTIGIRKHLGSSTIVDVMHDANVQDISYTYNVSEKTTNYSLSLYQKGNLQLGDELQLSFKPLGINAKSRIVGMDWNPFNYREVSITVGQYIPTVNDSLYELINEVQDIRSTTAKYTVEFGEMIGNGTFYFTRAYRDRPYYHIHTDDGSAGKITLNKKDGSAFSSYVGATLSGVSSKTTTVLVFYCTVPDEEDDE